MLSLEVKSSFDSTKFLTILNSGIDTLVPGIKLMAEAIKSDAPIPEIKEAIKYKARKTGFGVKGLIYGPWYWHFFEYGTQGHLVHTKKKKVLAGNGGIWGTNAYIPAIPQQSYIRKNMDSKKDDLLKLIVARIRQKWGKR